MKAIDKQINSFREKQKYDLMNKNIERQNMRCHILFKKINKRYFVKNFSIDIFFNMFFHFELFIFLINSYDQIIF